MIEDELVRIWQSSPNMEVIKFEKSRLMLEVQSGIDRIDKAIKVRDRNETIATLFVVPVFAYAAYAIPFLLSKIACILIIVWGIFVLIRLRKAKQSNSDFFSETYIDYLHKTKNHLLVQKHLLDTVFWWYVLPVIVCFTLFMSGFLGVPGKLPTIIKGEIGCIVAGLVIYGLNKWSVKTMLNPKIEKIDELIRLIEK